MICDLCGAVVATGKKFCTLCGSPLRQEKPFDAPYPGPAPTQSFQPPPPPPPLPTPIQTAADTGIDQSLLDEILDDDAKKTKRKRFTGIFKNPGLWFMAGTLLMVPSLALPWFQLFPGYSVGAFRLPISFLVTGQQAGAAVISAGTLLAAAVAALTVLSFLKIRTGTYIRIAAIVAIALSILSVLFAFRSWRALDKDPENYPGYVQSQARNLQDAFSGSMKFFGGRGDTGVQNIKFEDVKTASGMEFMKNFLRPGPLFAFAGGLFVLVATFILAKSLRFPAYNISPTPLAAIIVFASIVVFLVVTRFFFPARWHLIAASTYQTLGLKEKQEESLERCAALPVPALSCETDLAKLYYDTKRKGEAMKLYREINRKYPNYVEISKYMGFIYFVWQDYPSSAQHLRKYLKQYPSDLEARKKLSDALYALGSADLKNRHYELALKRLTESYELLPSNKTDESLNYELATLYDKMGDLKNAALYLSRAADTNPKNFVLQDEAARAFTAAGEYKSAMNYYRKCIDVKPDNTCCYLRGGDVALTGLKDRKLAKQWYESGLKANDVGDCSEDVRERLR